MDLEKLKLIISKHDVISFDVFDTLIKRNLGNNKDVFRLLECKVNKLLGTSKKIYDARIAAEANARKRCTYREVNIDEIYENFDDNYSENEKNLIKKMELEIELLVCTANQELQEIYNYCVSIEKPILIISDMYFSASDINKILEKNDYLHHKIVYSSCDERITKWEQGLLFKKVLEKERLLPSQVLHIGNDKNADFKKAKMQGLSAFLIDEGELFPTYYDEEGLFSQEIFTYNWINRFINNNMPIKENDIFKIGYEVFGPLLLGFTKWLAQQVEQKNLKKVFFFSRDGYILKKAFSLYCPNIDSKYFYISRKSVIRPILQYDKSFDDMVKHYKSWDKSFTLEYVLDRFCITVDDVVLDKFKLARQDRFNIDTLKIDQRVESLFDFIKEQIFSDSKAQAILIQSYFHQEQFYGNVGIIDMGAGCSIEFALKYYLKQENLDVNPFYFYLHSAIEENTTRNIFFDSGNKTKPYKVLLRFCYMFLEIFLTAPHGSVKGYQVIDNKVEPILADFEYIGDGKVDEKYYIQELQRGALSFFESSMNQFFDEGISTNIALQNFKNFAITPTLEDIKIWKDYRVILDELRPLILSSKASSFEDSINSIKNSPWLSGAIIEKIKNRYLMKLIFKFYYLYKKYK